MLDSTSFVCIIIRQTDHFVNVVKPFWCKRIRLQEHDKLYHNSTWSACIKKKSVTATGILISDWFYHYCAYVWSYFNTLYIVFRDFNLSVEMTRFMALFKYARCTLLCLSKTVVIFMPPDWIVGAHFVYWKSYLFWNWYSFDLLIIHMVQLIKWN